MRRADDTFLDDAFESFVAARSDGESFDWRLLTLERAHLEREIEELWQLACRMTASRVKERRLGSFDVLHELGRGAMGIVYLASQSNLAGRRVALKVLGQSLIVGERDRERFLVEARALARVKHAGVVEVFDVIDEPGETAIAMEWVEGGHLGDRIEAMDARGATRAEIVPFLCRVGVEIGRALGAVHAAGLMHRDVKPSNILLRKDGSAVLSDFGLVRDDAASMRTRSGVFMGTMAFAAPEQLRGERVDARADVYSLASTLYYGLTRTLPRSGVTPNQILRDIEEGSAPRLRRLVADLPRDLEVVVMKAMEAAPGDRYATADEFADDLERVLALQPIHGRPQGLRVRALKWAKRQRRGILAACAGAVVATAAIGWASIVASRADARAQRIDALVQEAHLALLDTRLEERVRIGLEHGHPALVEVVLERASAALDAYDHAIELGADSFERDAVAAGLASLRGEGSGVSDDSGEEATRLRAEGLRAYVAGDVAGAVRAWGALESISTPEPLVSALLGHAQLALGRPELAYTRLARAADEYPDAGALQAVAARAAIGCGDLDVARRLFAKAVDAAQPAEPTTMRSLEADLSWASGDVDAAMEIYRSHALPDSFLRSAQYAERQGDLERAIFSYGALISNEPAVVGHRRALLRVTRRFWDGLGEGERRRVVRGALAGEERDLGTFFGVLSQVARAIDRIAREASVGPVVVASRAGDAAFDREVLERRWRADSIEAFAGVVGVLRVDLERLTELPSVHEALVAHWFDGDGAAARALLVENGAWLDEGESSFDGGAIEVDAPFRVTGEVAGIELTFSRLWTANHVSIGDANGDGVPDFAIGAAAGPGAPARAGRVCAFSGADGALLWESVGAAYDDLGMHLAVLPDMDGDGRADVAVQRADVSRDGDTWLRIASGATGETIERVPVTGFGRDDVFQTIGVVGEADLVLGSHTFDGSRGALRAFDRDGRELWAVQGQTEGAWFGRALTNTGDVDGDGTHDVLVESVDSSGRDSLALHSGATGELVRTFTLAGLRGQPTAPIVPPDGALPIVLDTAAAVRTARLDVASGALRPGTSRQRGSDGFGQFVQSLGDLDGDGASEYAVSSLSGRSPHRPCVRVYRANGEPMATLRGFVWLRRLGLDPVLDEPSDRRFVAIGLERWSRYSDGPVGGPARVVLLTLD